LSFLQFLTIGSFTQSPTSSSQLLDQERYDSAKAQFENYERIHGGFIQTTNVNMHYLEWGNSQNTPLIWIHGSFTNGYELLNIADDLASNGYYVIAIDYYGHGQTKIPKHEVSLYHVADDIKTLMQAKKIYKAVIGGFSRGGIIASAFYDSYPEMVLGLILEDGGSVSTNSYYHQMEEIELKEHIRTVFKKRMSYASFNSEYEAYKDFYDSDQGGTQFELLAWLTKDSSDRWSIGTGTEALFNMDSEQQFLDTILRPTKANLFGESMSIIEPRIIYRNLTVPILILDPVSDQDLFPYETMNDRLKREHPNLISHKLYKDTGHNIHYERPDEFVVDLTQFLKTIKLHWAK